MTMWRDSWRKQGKSMEEFLNRQCQMSAEQIEFAIENGYLYLYFLKENPEGEVNFEGTKYSLVDDWKDCDRMAYMYDVSTEEAIVDKDNPLLYSCWFFDMVALRASLKKPIWIHSTDAYKEMFGKSHPWETNPRPHRVTKQNEAD